MKLIATILALSLIWSFRKVLFRAIGDVLAIATVILLLALLF